MSTCPIEFDIHFSCIQNHRNDRAKENGTLGEIEASIPIYYVKSLRALWHEEMKRRSSRSISAPLCSLTPPYTQTNHRILGESESEFQKRLENLYHKGEELHISKTGSDDVPPLSQWTRNCLDRQHQYFDSCQEFTQRAEQLIAGDDSDLLRPSIEPPPDCTSPATVDEEEQEENIEEGDDQNPEAQSQIDIEDILLTNTVFATGNDICNNNASKQTDAHRLEGYLYQVFEDSPVFDSNPLALHQTTKQGRRKRCQRDQNLSGVLTPDKGTALTFDRSPFPSDQFNSPFHFDKSPLRVPALTSNHSAILIPTFSPPTLDAVMTAFRESKSGWYHAVPHYTSLSDLPSGSNPLNSAVTHIQSSDKGRFGWLPQDVHHKDRVSESSTFMGHEDPLRKLLESRRCTFSGERILVPTFNPPRLTCPAVGKRRHPEIQGDMIQMTPVLSGSSQSQDELNGRIFFKTAIHYPSPLKSQIATPTQTQGNEKKVYAMNIKRPGEQVGKILEDGPQEDIRGRHTVLSMEIFCANRVDLLPNPKFDQVLCLCWDSHCYTAIGDGEVEQQYAGVICNCQTISADSLRLLVRGSCDLPPDVAILHAGTEKELIWKFVDVVRNQADPDILVGYEMQKDSWGYLIERAETLNISLLQELSRVPGEKPSSMNEHDKYGEEHESGIHITGRMTINLWRRMRHELKLFSYTIGSISRHLLGHSFPEHTSQQLNSWFRDKSNLHRVIRHTYRRAALNHSFIDKLDLIRRISESARLYGVEFYSVISRGSQFKVEAVMLRVAKKKGFVAISPSKRSVANQAAMAVIPLVMEPQSNFYIDPVNVLDFQSLYPSLIISYNLCFSTILAQLKPGIAGDEDTTGALGVLPYPEEYVVNNLYDTYRQGTNSAKSSPIISPSGALFVGRDIREGVVGDSYDSLILLGVLPIMLKEILDTRVMIKQSMKLYTSDTDKVLRRVLDARQLALKRLANVTYGYAGAGYSGTICISLKFDKYQDACLWQNLLMLLFSTEEVLWNGLCL